MKKWSLLILSIALLGLTAGCRTRKPLRLSHYRKNLIIDKFLNVRVEGQRGIINKNNLRQELVMRMVTEKSAIMVHVHRDVPREEFDDFLMELKAAGFKNLLFRIYKD